MTKYIEEKTQTLTALFDWGILEAIV
jgi:hypothetical protein